MQMQDENEVFAWPAFVDVLTTMTMILTFVMLILAGAVGSLTQKASRNIIESFNDVAREKGTPSISAEMPKQKILDAIREMEKNPSKKIPREEKQITVAPISKPLKQDEVKVEAAPTLLTLNYPSRQTRLDGQADKSLKDFLKSSKDILNAKTVEIHAFAPASAGSLTEARRIAYYRAMIVRLRVIGEGVRPEKIRLLVDDQFSADDTVKIFLD